MYQTFLRGGGSGGGRGGDGRRLRLGVLFYCLFYCFLERLQTNHVRFMKAATSPQRFQCLRFGRALYLGEGVSSCNKQKQKTLGHIMKQSIIMVASQSRHLKT